VGAAKIKDEMVNRYRLLVAGRRRRSFPAQRNSGKAPSCGTT
jgi:hypothetical protein